MIQKDIIVMKNKLYNHDQLPSLNPSPPSPPTPPDTPTGSLCEEDQPPPLPLKQRDQDGEYRMSVVSLPTGNKVGRD